MGYTYIASKNMTVANFSTELHNATNFSKLWCRSAWPNSCERLVLLVRASNFSPSGKTYFLDLDQPCLRNGEAELSRVRWLFVCQEVFRENWMEMISNSPKNMSITLRALESGGFCDVALTLFWFPWATACCNLAACCSNSIELWYWITRYDLST